MKQNSVRTPTGSDPNRSAETAIAQCMRLIQVQHLYHVVDLDIKGFFDNISHTKLIRQIWALGIRDKKAVMHYKRDAESTCCSARWEENISRTGYPAKAVFCRHCLQTSY